MAPDFASGHKWDTPRTWTGSLSQIMNSEIVLNRLFAGSFLDDHIGHEIVNLYKDDNGENYLYIQPYGTYHREHAGKIRYVLLVRGISGKQTVEVLGLATGLTELYNPSLTAGAMWKEHEEYLIREKVSYGGMPIRDIFDRSKEKAEVQPVYLSMKAEKVMRPSKKVYIVYKGGKGVDDPDAVFVELRHTNQAKCSLKQYFTEQDEDYLIIRELIERKNLWTIDTEQVDDNAQSGIEEDSFWNVCAIEDYELAWSSALAYFMRKYPELVVGFAKDFLNARVNRFDIVERETDNIDILLENDEEIVVIENKITSKINGIQVKDNKLVGTQLMKYHFKALERACGAEKPVGTYSQWKSLRQRCPKKISCFILAPNYNTINLDEYDTPFDDSAGSELFRCRDFYRQITYWDIYSFLSGKHPEDSYFQEMLKGMKKHTLEYHDDLFEVTRKKFIKQIRKLNRNNQ